MMSVTIPVVELDTASIKLSNKTKPKVPIAATIVFSVKDEINIPRDSIADANNINPKYPHSSGSNEMAGLVPAKAKI